MAAKDKKEGPVVNNELSYIYEINFNEKSAPIRALCQKIKQYGIHDKPEIFLPQIPKQDVKITFSNSYVEFANGIRRALIDELPVLYLDMNDDYLDTTEAYSLPDELRRNINLIPINQNIDMDIFNLYSITIDVENKTNSIQHIKASDIKIHDGKQTVELSTLIPNPEIILCFLFPTRKLSLHHIKIKRGIKLIDGAAKCSLLSAVTMVHTSISDEDKKSMIPKVRNINSQNTAFYIAFKTNSNIEAHDVFALLGKVLLGRLDKMQAEFALSMNNKSDMIVFKKVKNRHSFLISGEYITIPAMIASKIFQLDPTIKFVGTAPPNNTEINTMLVVDHSDVIGIISEAIAHIKREIASFVAQTKKIQVISKNWDIQH